MRVNWTTLKGFVDTHKLSPQYIDLDDTYFVKAFNGHFVLECEIEKNDSADQTEFETSYKMMKCNKPIDALPPFAAKTINGMSIYSRPKGMAQAVILGTTTFETVVSFPKVKFNELEIIGGEIGDNVNLKILDTAAGTYSGAPNYQLNQFGYTVNVAKDYYSRVSQYDADLYQGMRIVLEYTSVSAKTVYPNFIIHELK